jgi:hypothetical protein
MGGSPEPSEPKPPLREKSRNPIAVAGWGLAIYAGTRIAGILLDSFSMASFVAQAVIAEWGVAQLGVTWSDPEAEPPSSEAILKRALIGAGIGAVLAGLVTAFLVTTHAVSLSRGASAGAVSFVVTSIITAGLVAMRDELVLHGVTLRALDKAAPALLRVLACGVMSAAAGFGEGLPVRGVLARGLFGAIAGALWVRDRGAWLPWGASTAWLVTTDLFLHGGVYEAHASASTWAGDAAGPLAGSAAVVALLPFAAGAIVWAARR